VTEFPSYGLALANGSRWAITATDVFSAEIVAKFASAMQLKPSEELGQCLFVSSNGESRMNTRMGDIVCTLKSDINNDSLFSHFLDISHTLALEMQKRDGLLLHGALAELEGDGVIFIAPGGTGKTTASRRLPPPWISLSDDAVLVVRNDGEFWAHPWPTWSRFLEGEPGGSWNVQESVQLKNIFLLVQAKQDRVESIGTGQAVTMLLESARQVLHFWQVQNLEKRRSLHLERLENVCVLVDKIPVHILSFSLYGVFWELVEQILCV
jgi:SynChlorMet cassette protein ScmC